MILLLARYSIKSIANFDLKDILTIGTENNTKEGDKCSSQTSDISKEINNGMVILVYKGIDAWSFQRDG